MKFQPGNLSGATHSKEAILANWRQWFANRRDDAEYQQKIFRQAMEAMNRPSAEESDALAEMRDTYMETVRRAIKQMESECPIGFFKPSWEQAQIINACHPLFDPEESPEGYQSIGIFSANRIGKSCAVFISVLLWFIANDPAWVMFEEHEDPPLYVLDGDPSSGIRRPSRGKYRVLPRPAWDSWKRNGRLIYPGTSEAPMAPCEAWHGCENDTDWNERICGRWGGKDGYLAWMPRSLIAMRSDGGEALFKQERKIIMKTGHAIMGKTYNSNDQAWAGKAVRIMAMDEGFEMSKLIESTTRVEAGGYYFWAFTPTDARNLGGKSAVAHAAYRGDVPLVGKSKFFVNFKMEDAPEHVLPAEKRQTDMARFAKLGVKGKARMEGGFFDSSPRVFSNFDRAKHVLPWNGTEVLAAIRGQGPDHLVFLFQDALIIRGFDEGTVHPTTCAWVAILRTGEYVLFREFSETNLSVSERCEKIIELSRNKREISHYHNEESLRRYVETVPIEGMKIKRTFADSKIFKRNPENPSDDWIATYRKNGLKLERATSMGPEARCDSTNDMFRGDQTRRHLVTKEAPGYRLYLTVDCELMIERLENYLQEQYTTGINAGQFTGRPGKFGDDELDSLCYACCSKMKWIDSTSSSHTATAYDPFTGAVVR